MWHKLLISEHCLSEMHICYDMFIFCVKYVKNNTSTSVIFLKWNNSLKNVTHEITVFNIIIIGM